MYLQKSVVKPWNVGQDEEGNLFKWIVVFMIVSLKKSIPIVIGSLAETKITGEWWKCEINKFILDLAEVRFKARAVITDDHPSNANAFTRLYEIFDGENKTFIKHPAFADFATKNYLLFDVIHLFKNIGNNLLNQKKFAFPSFQFDLFHDAIHVQDGYISWLIFHEVHERDEHLQAPLRKAPKKRTRWRILVTTNRVFH